MILVHPKCEIIFVSKNLFGFTNIAISIFIDEALKEKKQYYEKVLNERGATEKRKLYILIKPKILSLFVYINIIFANFIYRSAISQIKGL